MRVISGICLVLLIFASAQGQADDYWRVSGYYKNFFVVSDEPFSDNDFGQGQTTNRLRISLNYAPSEVVEANFAYDIIPTIYANYETGFIMEEIAGARTGNMYRADDLNTALYPENPEFTDRFRINQNLDRLFLAIHASFGDMYFGRQAIAWGSARTINPTDVLGPFAYDELDVEDRRGVDAVRLRIPLGFMGEIDIGYLSGYDFNFDESAVYFRGKQYLGQTDLSGMVVIFQENLMLGIDLARSLEGAGIWLEAAWVNPDEIRPYDDAVDEESYFRATVGADYSFGDKTYGFLEYHYNGAGSSDPEKYFSLHETVPYREGGVFLMGEHYLIPGINYQITPLITLNGSTIFNLSDQSAILMPSLEYNIAENIYLSGGAYLGLGKKGRMMNLPYLGYLFESEFGDYPNTLYTSFRVYF